MTARDDPVAEACQALAGYLPVLERLVAEPSAEGPAPGFTPRPSASPVPGNAAAFHALMDAHEGVRRLKAVLLYLLTGHPGSRHGGSDGNTAEVLEAIPKLAAGLPDEVAAAAVRALDRRINEARSVRAIDEARRWRSLPGRQCPYCGGYWLKADMDARPVVIACHAVYRDGPCQDGNGLQPVAMMGTDASGRPCLAWPGGLTETAPDLPEDDGG